ncbi:unnamed protein product, partial [marine sediment metagenome]
IENDELEDFREQLSNLILVEETDETEELDDETDEELDDESEEELDDETEEELDD